MLFSVPFLIVTFLVYAFIPDLRNLHGKCFMCYLICLSLLYISLASTRLFSADLKTNAIFCVFIGYMTYTCIFFCFFWQNVICFDIWSAFKGVQASRSKGNNSRFFLYSLYAFGVPIILTLLMLLMDNLSFIPEVMGPGIGEERCILKSKF